MHASVLKRVVSVLFHRLLTTLPILERGCTTAGFKAMGSVTC